MCDNVLTASCLLREFVASLWGLLVMVPSNKRSTSQRPYCQDSARGFRAQDKALALFTARTWLEFRFSAPFLGPFDKIATYRRRA